MSQKYTQILVHDGRQGSPVNCYKNVCMLWKLRKFLNKKQKYYSQENKYNGTEML